MNRGSFWILVALLGFAPATSAQEVAAPVASARSCEALPSTPRLLTPIAGRLTREGSILVAGTLPGPVILERRRRRIAMPPVELAPGLNRLAPAERARGSFELVGVAANGRLIYSGRRDTTAPPAAPVVESVARYQRVSPGEAPREEMRLRLRFPTPQNAAAALIYFGEEAAEGTADAFVYANPGQQELIVWPAFGCHEATPGQPFRLAFVDRNGRVGGASEVVREASAP